jgi:hypothetical protein
MAFLISIPRQTVITGSRIFVESLSQRADLRPNGAIKVTIDQPSVVPVILAAPAARHRVPGTR